MEEDILQTDFIINPTQGRGLSGIATSAEPLLQQGSQLGDIQEVEPGVFLDRTSVTSVNDLFNYYFGGMPSQQPVEETPAVEAGAVVTPAVDTGSQDQATGDLTGNTQFEQNLIDQGAGVQIAPEQPVVAPGEVPVTQQEIDEYNLNTQFEQNLIDQGVGIQTEPGAPVGAQGERFDQSPQDYAASRYGLDYDSLDQEEQAIIDQELNPTPEIEPATTLTDIVNLSPTVQIAKGAIDLLTPDESVSEQLTIDPDTGLFEGGDPGVDAEENQPYNQDFVTQVSGPVETNQLSMMQEYYNKPIEERIAETTGYNPQDISLAGFDLKEGATPENVQAVIDILNTVGAVASLGSTEAVKKAAVEIIKREAARKTTKAVIDAATSLQLDDSSEPTLSEADQEFAETGDYDVYSGTSSPQGPAYSGTATVGTSFDAEDDGGSDDTSSSSSQDQGETSSDAGFSESRGRDTDVQQSGTTDSGGSSGGGGGKIVCTMMNETYGFGSFRNKIWQKYARDNLTKEHETGYHKIFLPLVRISKTNIVIRKILEHIAVHRTIDIRQESRGKTHMLGRIYRKILEPICYWVGKYAKR